jgi:glucan phosphoethanolaminetransferase (alkaline phosphatase superfamily)
MTDTETPTRITTSWIPMAPKWFLAISSVLLVLLTVVLHFYFEYWRPGQIRSSCASDADKVTDSSKQVGSYNWCIVEAGLGPSEVLRY